MAAIQKRSSILQVGRLFKTETHSFYPNPVIQIRIPCQDHLCSLSFGFFLAFTQTLFRLKYHQYTCVADQDVGNERFRYLHLPDLFFVIFIIPFDEASVASLDIIFFCLLRLFHYIANSFPYVGISAIISQTVSYHHNRPNVSCRRTLRGIWEDLVSCSRNVVPNKNIFFFVLIQAKITFEIHRIYLEAQ